VAGCLIACSSTDTKSKRPTVFLLFDTVPDGFLVYNVRIPTWNELNLKSGRHDDDDDDDQCDCDGLCYEIGVLF
jgi:hypothetical protein